MMWKQSNFGPPPCLLCCATGNWPVELATWHFSGKAQQAGWNWDNRNILRATLKSDQNWPSDFAKSLRNWDTAKIIVRISLSPEIYFGVFWHTKMRLSLVKSQASYWNWDARVFFWATNFLQSYNLFTNLWICWMEVSYYPPLLLALATSALLPPHTISPPPGRGQNLQVFVKVLREFVFS